MLRATHSKAFGPTSVSTTIGVLWDPGSDARVRLMRGNISIATARTVHITAGTAAASGTICSLDVPADESIPFEIGDGAERPPLGVELGIKLETGTAQEVVATLSGREERF